LNAKKKLRGESRGARGPPWPGKAWKTFQVFRSLGSFIICEEDRKRLLLAGLRTTEHHEPEEA